MVARVWSSSKDYTGCSYSLRNLETLLASYVKPEAAIKEYVV